jgi:alpha-L-fucosidase 2
MDNKLLVEKVYPYIHEVADYLGQITYMENGKRKLPLSSSPEYNDNAITAWFQDWTNYDLALAKFLFSAAAEVCDSLHKKAEGLEWLKILKQLPGYAVNATGLAIAEGQNLDISHRHLSPYMAIYPLALLNIQNPGDKSLIELSLEHIRQKGTGEWCGYTFGWMACIYAITRHADSAAKMLRIFAADFCSPNSFHLNGDQKGAGYSRFTYRPFTLEGNFAFAQGLQEMLLQSHLGYIDIFPAVPGAWKDISFSTLRAQGGFSYPPEKKTL